MFTSIFSHSFSWILGFGVKILTPVKVAEALPTFIELAFLRQLKSVDVMDSIIRSFNRQDLLTHTSILLFALNAQQKVDATELVRTNPDRPWGLALPECPSCSTAMFMTSSMNKDRCSLRCERCQSTSRGITRPDFVAPCERSFLERHKYFICPFPEPDVAWRDLVWVVKMFKGSQSSASGHS